METYINYRGYGIRYVTIGGTTFVEGTLGSTIEEFRGLGEMDGKKAAKKYIDELIDGERQE